MGHETVGVGDTVAFDQSVRRGQNEGTVLIVRGGADPLVLIACPHGEVIRLRSEIRLLKAVTRASER